MTTVSIVEDNKEYRDALKSVIQDADGFVVTHVYGSAEDAMNIIDQPTNIAIVDIQLPGMNGIELIKHLRQKDITTSFLVCSINDDDESIFNALKSGASGYILKDSRSEQIIDDLNEL